MKREKILIDFSHGLGDAVQLTLVLQHLQKYHPTWDLNLFALIGKHSVGKGYCSNIWHDKEARPNKDIFDRQYNLQWVECYSTYTDSPSTKACNCLREIFHITPDQNLLKYKLFIDDEVYRKTVRYLNKIGAKKIGGRYNAVIIHYQGNTSPEKKNVDHCVMHVLCELLIDEGYIPVILDWDRRSPLPNQKTIFNPIPEKGDIWGSTGTGDASSIAALVEQSSLFIGIDSGPQKCAGATNTPSIGLWTGHLPVQFFDLCDNFIHLLPANWPTVPPATDPKAARYMSEHYQYRTYNRKPTNLASVLCEEAFRLLRKRYVTLHGFTCNADKVAQDFVIIEDVYLKDAYKTRLIEKSNKSEIVVDIGAHIGAFSRLWHERNPNARIFSVECCEDIMPQLESNISSFATIIPVACTYKKHDLYLINSKETTGGNMVVKKSEYDEANNQYVKVPNPVQKITLHEIMKKYKLSKIDVLKLDCEGSEFDILENAPLNKIGFIYCESHDSAKWRKLLIEKFKGWDIGHMSQNGNYENWHLRNPKYKG